MKRSESSEGKRETLDRRIEIRIELFNAFANKEGI
jgi:predicted HTH domain antitoxin